MTTTSTNTTTSTTPPPAAAPAITWFAADAEAEVSQDRSLPALPAHMVVVVVVVVLSGRRKKGKKAGNHFLFQRPVAFLILLCRLLSAYGGSRDASSVQSRMAKSEDESLNSSLPRE